MKAKTNSTEEIVNILIVDDSPTQVEHLKYILEEHSYSVTAANSGGQALAHIGKHTPTLVITDIVMPEMSGYELCQKIKAEEKTRDIPVILLTSLSSTEDVLEGLACGADNFISKPYSEQYLLTNIANILINMKLRKSEYVRLGMEIQFGGKKRFITADQQQMLSMLISTYEAAVNRNKELIQAQDELKTMNDNLEDMVEKRTAMLNAEITERRKGDDALRESEDKYKSLIENIPDIIFTIDLEGKITFINQRMKEILGYESAETINMNILNFIPQEDHQRAMENLQKGMKGEKIKHFQIPMIAKSGEMLFFECSFSRIYKDGAVGGAQGTAVDITERKQADEELRRHREHLEVMVAERTTELQAVNRELEAFSYSVSHDLRAPLRSVDAYARMIEEDYAERLDDEGRRLLQVIRDSAHEMDQLISDLLAFSRLSRKGLKMGRIGMRGLVTEARRQVEQAETGRAIRWDIGELPPAFGDEAMIREALINLLANAVKYTRPRQDAAIGISGRVEGDDVVYSVTDNGVGFDMTYKDKLFCVFQRLHSAAEFEGTGIGLALVQRIVQRHGGRVWAEGKVNEGATFYFTLPWKANEEGRM